MAPRVLVTGSTGFIGSRVVSAALADPEVRVRLLRHRGTPAAAPSARVQIVPADLSEVGTVRDLCRGVDAVVHCASRVGGDEESLRRVNDQGTKALVEDAARHGVDAFVYVSSAAVYGRGPFRRAAAGALPPRPASATSRSRAAAERHVLATGGTVLRPHLVYGAGDRWVVPGLAALIRHLGAPVHCPSVHSAIEAGALARAALAAARCKGEVTGAHHVNHPVPLNTADLMELIREHLGMPAGPALSPAQARKRIGDGPETAFARHHLEMLVADHWFLGDRIWQLPACDPGPPPADGLRRLLPGCRQPPGASGRGPAAKVPQARHEGGNGLATGGGEGSPA